MFRLIIQFNLSNQIKKKKRKKKKKELKKKKRKKKKKDLKWKTRNHVLFRITRLTYYPKVTVLKFTRDLISIVLYAKTGQRNTIYLFFCFLDSEFKLCFRVILWVELLFKVKKENNNNDKKYIWAYVEL